MPTQSKYSNTLVNFENLRIPISHNLDMGGYSLTNYVYYGDGSNLSGVGVTGMSFSSGLLELRQTPGPDLFVSIPSSAVTGLSFSNDFLFLYQTSGATLSTNIPTGAINKGSFGITTDGSVTVITVGSKGYVSMPYNGYMTDWQLVANDSGNLQIDVKGASFSNFPTTTSITGGNYIGMTSSQKASDSTLPGWSTSFAKGDVFEFVVVSCSIITKFSVFIATVKTS